MARAQSFSLRELEEIAKKLTARGEQITPYRVQRMLGRGSIPAITRMLREHNIGVERAGLPHGTDPDLIKILNLLQPVVNEFRTQAQADMAAQAERHEEEVAKLESSLREAKEDQETLQGDLTEAMTEAESLETALEQVRTELAETTTSLTEKSEQLAVALNQNESLAARLKDKQEAMGALQATVESERLASQQRYEDVKQSHAHETATMYLRLEALENRVTELLDNNQTLNTQNAGLVAERSHLQREVRSLKDELNRQAQKLDEKGEALATIREVLKSTQKELNDKTAELARLDKHQQRMETDQRRLATTAAALLDAMPDKLPAKASKAKTKLASLLADVDSRV